MTLLRRCSPAPPGLGQVLQDGPGLVLLDALRHHVQNVMLHMGTQPQSHTTSSLANPPPELPLIDRAQVHARRQHTKKAAGRGAWAITV